MALAFTAWLGAQTASGWRRASHDQTAKVWDAATGKEVLTLSGHHDLVLSVAWSPDGQRLATASYDHTAKVWEAATGKEVLTLSGHSGAAYAVAWSSGGKYLATASDDGTVQVYAMDIKSLVDLARQRVTAFPSVDGCKKYLHADRTATLMAHSRLIGGVSESPHS